MNSSDILGCRQRYQTYACQVIIIKTTLNPITYLDNRQWKAIRAGSNRGQLSCRKGIRKNPFQLLVYNLWIISSCSEILVVNVVIQQSRVANTNIHHRKKHTHNIATLPRMLKGSVILHIHLLFRPTRTSKNINSTHCSGRVNISCYLYINSISGI